MAVRRLLVGHVTDVGLACVGDVSKELAVNAEAFSEDVLEIAILREEWHAVKVFNVADHRSVVHVNNLERDVLGVRQTIA
ncbi:MAG: hypothetical protein QF699_01180, partial [Candidatus Poseidoniaceae archaeon]|nr:hypothetical protein [Candidatus Poseidoniaceae archaeon]